MSEPSSPPPTEPTLGGLVHDLSQQIPGLIRAEMRLAQAEVTEKGKSAGIGLGLFSVAGLLAFYAVATLVATAVMGLSHAVPAWVAGLVVAAVLLVGAALVGLAGKHQVAEASPAKPEMALEGLKEDVAIIRGARS